MRPAVLNTRKSAGLLLFVTLAYLAIPSASGDPISFSGTVVTERDHLGIPNLTVSLSPHADSMKAKKVTTTNNEGRFTLNELESGQYLLEVFQGLTILYREVVNVPQQNPTEIRLSPK